MFVFLLAGGRVPAEVSLSGLAVSGILQMHANLLKHAAADVAPQMARNAAMITKLLKPHFLIGRDRRAVTAKKLVKRRVWRDQAFLIDSQGIEKIVYRQPVGRINGLKGDLIFRDTLKFTNRGGRRCVAVARVGKGANCLFFESSEWAGPILPKIVNTVEYGRRVKNVGMPFVGHSARQSIVSTLV